MNKTIALIDAVVVVVASADSEGKKQSQTQIVEMEQSMHLCSSEAHIIPPTRRRDRAHTAATTVAAGETRIPQNDLSIEYT